jgi:hypothetical protein
MMVSADTDPRRAGTIWMLNLDSSTPVITPHIPATFCQVESQDVNELAEVMVGDDPGEIEKRLKTGRRCYAARVDGLIAAYGWVSFDEEFIGEQHLRLRLAADEAYIWNCVTLPAFRRNYLYSALLTYIVRELYLAHLSRVWIGADQDNIPSQRGIAHAGFTCIADLLVVRVLTLRQVWVQGRDKVPESLVAEARRVFLNDRDNIWQNVWSSKQFSGGA